VDVFAHFVMSVCVCKRKGKSVCENDGVKVCVRKCVCKRERERERERERTK